jgi:hypothetical protein
MKEPDDLLSDEEHGNDTGIDLQKQDGRLDCTDSSIDTTPTTTTTTDTTTTSYAAAVAIAQPQPLQQTTIKLHQSAQTTHVQPKSPQSPNGGKSPRQAWNKGLERPETTRAKIGAGVRSRHRDKLQQKLQYLNMTPEEWYDKRREIKLLGERIRKAKQAGRNYKAFQEQLRAVQSELRLDNFVFVPQQQVPMESTNATTTMCFRKNDDLHPTTKSKQILIDRVLPMYQATKSDTTLLPLQNASIPTNQYRRDVDGTTLNTVCYTSTSNSLRRAERILPASLPPPPLKPKPAPPPTTKPKLKAPPPTQREVTLVLAGDETQSCPNDGPGGLICCQYCMVRYTDDLIGEVDSTIAVLIDKHLQNDKRA